MPERRHQVAAAMLAPCIALATWSGPAGACTPGGGVSAKAVSAGDDGTVLLDDGSLVSLVNALVPSAPLWWKSDKPWRAGARAREALAMLVEGHEVELRYSGDRADRRERLLAQVYVAGEGGSAWVQQRLIEEGNARVYSLAGNRACAKALLAAEAKARANRAGLWADSYYAVADAAFPDRVMKRLYSYELVEGRVRAVAETRNWVFLNFGADWRRDFTVAIAARDKGAFSEAGYVFADLKGRRIRARGWIERWNGPVIKATHPEQIELLESGASSVEAGAK